MIGSPETEPPRDWMTSIAVPALVSLLFFFFLFTRFFSGKRFGFIIEFSKKK